MMATTSVAHLFKYSGKKNNFVVKTNCWYYPETMIKLHWSKMSRN